MPWRFLLFGLVVLLVSNAVTLVFLLAGLEITEPGDATGSQLAGVVALFVANGAALVGATVLAARALDRRTLADLGLGIGAHWWRDLAVGGALGVGLVGGAYVAGLAVGVFEARPEPTAPPGYPLVAWLGLVALMMVAVGVSEEVLVRGYLLTNLAEGFTAVVTDRRAVAGALAVSSVGFGLLHGINPAASPLGIATISVAGLLLGLGYVCTGSLALPIGLHVTWNLTHVLLGLPVSGLAVEVALLETRRSGPAVVHGGAFGPEGGLLGLAATLLGCLVVVGYARHTGRGDPPDVAVPELLTGDENRDRRENENGSDGFDR